MAETAYPYATYLDIKFDPLKLIDVSLLAKAVTDQWYNQTLCKVNDSVVRLGVMQGEYHWHKHDNDDESSISRVARSSFCPTRALSFQRVLCIARVRRRRASF
jgi:hypothetical protein